MQQRPFVVAFYFLSIYSVVGNNYKGRVNMNFGELITAMVTPFNEKGEIDYEATTNLINHLIENGTDSVVVAGTTGESPTLSTEEKLSLFEHVVKVVDGRIPVIAGTGSNDTASSIALTKEAEALKVDGIMLVAPYYNRPSQEGLYKHFKAIAEATSLPVMIYNIPGRTSVNIDVDTIVRLSKIDNVFSVKEASGNLEAMTEIIARTDDDFVLYSGDDSLTLPVLSIGGKGIVSVAGHIVGKEMKAMIEAFKAGKVKEASEQHQQLLPIFQTMFIEPSPSPLKAALNEIGVPVGNVRLPLAPLSEEGMAQLQKALPFEKWKVK